LAVAHGSMKCMTRRPIRGAFLPSEQLYAVPAYISHELVPDGQRWWRPSRGLKQQRHAAIASSSSLGPNRTTLACLTSTQGVCWRIAVQPRVQHSLPGPAAGLRPGQLPCADNRRRLSGNKNQSAGGNENSAVLGARTDADNKRRWASDKAQWTKCTSQTPFLCASPINAGICLMHGFNATPLKLVLVTLHSTRVNLVFLGRA